MTIAKAPFVADELDRLLFATFPGLVIRKDLAQEIRGTSKAPSYVIEFMLGKYCANLFDDASGFVSEQERKVVVDRALAVMQIGVAHAARPHPNERLARSRIRDQDRLDRHRLAGRPRHHTPHVVCHGR